VGRAPLANVGVRGCGTHAGPVPPRPVGAENRGTGTGQGVLDSTIVPVFGRGKQGAAFGYTKVRGYHPQLATCAQTGQVVLCRLRGGPRRQVVPDRDRQSGPSRRRHRDADRARTRRFTPARCCPPPASSTSGSPAPPARTARSAQRSRPSPRPHGRQSRTGCPPPRFPAPTSPRPATAASPAPVTRSTCGRWCAAVAQPANPACIRHGTPEGHERRAGVPACGQSERRRQLLSRSRE
jgi:hypothetical protein